jgi:death on curing protein
VSDEVVWIEERIALAIHAAQIDEHGGASGLRDSGGLRAALARPQLRSQYESSDLADLAASLAVGIAKRHPFVDGNKRVAFVVLELFLELNGARLVATDIDCVDVMLAVAAGDLGEAAFSGWIRAHVESGPEASPRSVL